MIWLGIFVFVMIPLPITGPAAGSIIAYFLKFSIRRNFAAVFTGTLLSIIIWTCFFDYLDRHIAIFKYVVVAVLLIGFLYYFRTLKRWFTQETEEWWLPACAIHSWNFYICIHCCPVGNLLRRILGISGCFLERLAKFCRFYQRMEPKNCDCSSEVRVSFAILA